MLFVYLKRLFKQTKPSVWQVIRTGLFACVFLLLTPYAQAAISENTLRIHYNRSDGDYTGWGLHLWGDVNFSREITWNAPFKPTGHDAFGVYFDVPLAPKAQRVGFILHFWDEKNYPKDLTWNAAEHGREIWQLEDDGTIYTTTPPQILVGVRAVSDRPVNASERVVVVNIPAIGREQRAYEETQRRKTEIEIEKLRLETQKLRDTAAQIKQETKPIPLANPTPPQPDIAAPPVPSNTAPEVQPPAISTVGTPIVAQEDNWLLWVLGGLGALLVIVFAGVIYRLQSIRTIVKEQQTILRHTQMLMQQELHTKQGPLTGQPFVNTEVEQDDLTGLSLRKQFLTRVDETIINAKKYGENFAVLNIEMSNFADISRQIGHDFSDIVLKHSADRIRNLLREKDFIARDKENRFLVLLNPIAHYYVPKQLAEKIHQELLEPIVFDRVVVQVQTKIGMSLFPHDAEQGLLLLHQAENALLRVSTHPSLSEVYYTDSLNTDYQQRDTLLVEVVQALEDQNFELHYQPLYDVKTLRLLGFEALLRCNRPTLLEVSPSQCMPVLEEAGLAMRLFYWQFDVAMKQLQDWQNHTLSLSQDTFVSLNLSAGQFFSMELLPFLNDKIQKKMLDPAHLHLEVQESTLISDLNKSAAVLQGLADMGVLVLIDHFGSALSVLPQMKHLPLYAVKMSGEFLVNIEKSVGDLAVAEALMALASSLRLQVIIFGVEKKEYIDYLQGHECDMVQGQALCPPCNAKTMSERLHASISQKYTL